MESYQFRYQNQTTHFQIISIRGLERYLSPGSCIDFEAFLSDSLFIKDGCITTCEADHISCSELTIIV